MKHTLFITKDDLRSLDLDELLQTVITNDNSSVEVVDVGCSKASAIERNEWAEIRRNDRDNLHYHPLRTVLSVRLLEPLNYLKSLQKFCLTLLRRLDRKFLAEFLSEFLYVDFAEEFINTLGAHLGDELVRIGI